MARPKICRRVLLNPRMRYFKPQGIPLKDVEEVVLTVEEFEAIRLNDLEGFGQIECSKKMHVSQPTFHRVISSARKKISDAIVNGKAIKIEGGNFRIA